jgi:FkbM family methyltransferase
MGSVVNRLLGVFGLEVHLTRNMVADYRRARNEYERERWQVVQGFDLRTILDVGANEGQFAAHMRKLCPQARIFSFEPLPEVHSILIERFRTDAMVTAVNLAIGDRAGEVLMNRSEQSHSSSLLPMGALHRDEFPASAGHSQVSVSVVRLDDWVAANSTLPAGELLVKLDVQGFESAAIDGGQETLRRARLAIIEVSFYELYEGQALFAGIFERMAALGYVFRGCVEQHYSVNSRRILFADAVFENTRRVDAR